MTWLLLCSLRDDVDIRRVGMYTSSDSLSETSQLVSRCRSAGLSICPLSHFIGRQASFRWCHVSVRTHRPCSWPKAEKASSAYCLILSLPQSLLKVSVPSEKWPSLILAYLGQRIMPVLGAIWDGKDAHYSRTCAQPHEGGKISPTPSALRFSRKYHHRSNRRLSCQRTLYPFRHHYDVTSLDSGMS